MPIRRASDTNRPAAVPCASGMAVLDMRWSIETHFGREALDASIARMTAAARDEYVHATALSWVTYSTLAQLHDALATVTRTDPLALADRLARVTVERSFRTVWRVFLRFTSDEAIIARTPAFYSKSRNMGVMSTRIVLPGMSETVASKFPAIPDRDIVILGASIETVLTLAGRRDVTSRGERTPDGAKFITRWRT